MTGQVVPNVRWLLDELEDPFRMFPVESVADTLFEAVERAENEKAENMGPWGVARKFWSVEEEHHHEEIGLLIGAMFVLGQAAITQTVSILHELNRHAQDRVIPGKKREKLIAHAPIDPETGLSKVVIIDAVSNYFKHVYEWPEKWHEASATGAQAETIQIVRQIGMAPGEIPDNLMRAAGQLELYFNRPRAIANCVQEWREAWARVLYPAFEIPDPVTT